MARLNITVPDELQERITVHRDRMNFSRICAEALEQAVQGVETELERLEILREEVGEMDALIERLKGEKEEALPEWFEKGRKQAGRWINTAQYKEVKAWAGDAEQALVNVHNSVEPPRLPDEVYEEWKDYRSDDPDLVPDGGDEAIEYGRGFYVGLVEMWEIIEDKI